MSNVSSGRNGIMGPSCNSFCNASVKSNCKFYRMIDNNVISIIYYESPCEIQAWSTGYKLIGTAYGFQVPNVFRRGCDHRFSRAGARQKTYAAGPQDLAGVENTKPWPTRWMMTCRLADTARTMVSFFNLAREGRDWFTYSSHRVTHRWYLPISSLIISFLSY